MKQTNHANLVLNRALTMGEADRAYTEKQIAKGGKFMSELLEQIITTPQLTNVFKNQKGTKRLIQSLNFILNGDQSAFDPITAYMVSTVALTKQDTVTYKDTHFLCGVNKEDANNIKGVSRAKLSRFLPDSSKEGTVKSKVSRTVGINGFFTHMGIANKEGAHAYKLTNEAKNHAFILAYSHQLEKMTEQTFLIAKEKINKAFKA